MKSFGIASLALLVALAAGCGGGGNGDETSPGAVAPSGTTATGPPPSGTSPSPPARTGGEPAPDEGQTTDRRRKKRTRRTGAQEREPSKGGEPSAGKGATPESRRVERYLRDNFGGGAGEPETDWYDHIVEVAVSGRTTTIRTDLSAGRAGKRLAREICLIVRGSLPGLTDIVRVTGLEEASTLAKCVP